MALLRTVLFFLAIVTSLLYSQKPLEMSVVAGSAKEEPAELVSKEIRDANGTTAAGLIIYSDLKGLTFQSYNGVVKVNSSPGKDFLFLSPDERVVEVYCFGYTPLQIILSEQGIRLKSGQTWSVKITGEKKLELIPVNIIVKPSDAKIFIDGKEKGSVSSHQLSPGKHALRVERSGYIPYAESIDVNINNSLFTITLNEQDVLPLTVISVPTGAKIYLNDVDRGETDKGLYLLPNKYTIRLSKAGYSDTTVTINHNEKSPKSYSFTLSKNTGTLKFTVEPNDATVLIDKENIGSRREIELVPGTHKIEIDKPNYYPVSEFLEVQKNRTLTRQFVLTPKTGSLVFSVNPLSAASSLSLNGVEVQKWTGINQLKNLLVGSYVLRVNAEGFEPIVKTVTITENATVNEDISMVKTEFGSLVVNAEPSGASIQLKRNDSLVSVMTNGQTVNRIKAGVYDIVVSYSGYNTEIKKVLIQGGIAAKEKITLTVYTPPFSEQVGDFFSGAAESVGDGVSYLFTDDEAGYGDLYHSGWFVGYQSGSDSPDDPQFEGGMNGLRLGMIFGDEDFSFEFSYGYLKSDEKNPSTAGIETDWTVHSIEFNMAQRIGFFDLYTGFDFRMPSAGTVRDPLGFTPDQPVQDDLLETSIRYTLGANIWLGGNLMFKGGYYMDLTDFTGVDRVNGELSRSGWYGVVNVRVLSF